jgi:NADPH:quinone reductase-like Zn-dependent oxidoreductase
VEGDLTRLMLKRLTITGSTLRIRTDAYKAALAASVVKHVWPMIASGKFRPVIDKVFPLGEADAAHAWLDSGTATGKVILEAAKS